MSHAHPIRALLPALAAAGACLVALPSGAQTIDELKKQDSRYIDWLKEYKAAQVLEHYAQGANGKMSELAKISLAIAVASTKIEALYEVARVAKPEEQLKLYQELRKATEDLLAAKRERIEKFSNDDAALYWQTGLLSDQIETYLRQYRNNAVAVYEFGSPDADQTKGFAEVMPVAYLTAVRAAKTADGVQRRMMSDRKYIRDLTRSGLRNRIEDSLAQAKYWLGATSYWMTLLPDTHPYYAGLGKPGPFAVPGQKATPAEERKRLLRAANEALATNTTPDGQALYACVLLAEGKTKDALKAANAITLDDFTEMGAASLAARLIAAKAKVTAAAGKRDDAIKALRAQASANPAILAELKEGSGQAYLFVCDAAYRQLLEASKQAKPPQDVELFNKAFLDPYADIFGDGALQGADEGTQRAIRGLRPVLQQRWAAEFKDMPADRKPGILVLQTLDVEFSQLFAAGGLWETLKKEAADEQGIPNPANVDPAKVKELLGKMRRVEDSITSALGKEKIGVIRAKLLNQRALLRFLGAQACAYLGTDPKNVTVAEADQTLHAAAMDWYELAKVAPESADAEKSIDYATGFLHALHAGGRYPADYATAGKLLFDKYGTTKAAARELPYYAEKVLMAQGKVDEALTLLRKMPKEDDSYFAAQQKAVLLLDRVRKTAQAAIEAKKGTPEASAAETKFMAAADAVIKAAATLEDEAKKAGKDTTPGYRRASARYVLASTLVLHANALAAKGAANEGVALLEDFETAFAPETLMAREDFQNEDDFRNMQQYLAAQVEYAQVSRLRMLMDAGQGDQVKARALKLLDSGNPNSLLILKGLLRDIKSEVERVTSAIGRTTYEPLRRELSVKRQTYGQAMLDLTKILRERMLENGALRKDHLDKLVAQAAAATPAGQAAPAPAVIARQHKEYLDLLLVQAMSASGDMTGAVAELDRLIAAEKDAVAQDKNYPRSLNLLLVASQTYLDQGMSIANPADPGRTRILVKASNTAKSIAENFRTRGVGPNGFESAFYEAFWVQMAALEALPSSEKYQKHRDNIPTEIDKVAEMDPKGFEALPWKDRFIELKDRMLLELQNRKK